MNNPRRTRRLLLHAPPSTGGKTHSLDTNMLIILAALLCLLICVLGINSIVRFVLRCTGRLDFDEPQHAPPRVRRKSIAKGLIRRIPVAVYVSGEEGFSTECPICLSEFVDGEKIRVLPECGHCFHVKCVDVWLGENLSCPTCRRKVVAECGGDAVVGVAGGVAGHGDASVNATGDDVG